MLQICDNVQTKGYTVVKDPEGRMGPYAYRGNQWVGFDDTEMIRKKVRNRGRALSQLRTLKS